MRWRWTLVHRIYEPQLSATEPILEHRFHGASKRQCRRIYRAHTRADRFLAACQRTGRYGDIPCRTTLHWERYR